MADAVSALGGATSKGAVDVAELGLSGMITVRGDLASTGIKNAVTGVAGVDMPDQRAINTDGGRGIAWMSPDELLVLVPYDEAAGAAETMQAALGDDHALVVNVSDARAHFRINGAGMREVLAKGAPVDFSPEAFGKGQIRRSRVGQVAAAFWISGEDSFDLVCFRSVAGYMFDWLTTAAKEGSLPGYYR